MRDHPLMENSVVSVPLMIRSGVTYTKLAVTLTTVSNGKNKQNATVLHLGTGEGEKYFFLYMHAPLSSLKTCFSLGHLKAQNGQLHYSFGCDTT